MAKNATNRCSFDLDPPPNQDAIVANEGFFGWDSWSPKNGHNSGGDDCILGGVDPMMATTLLFPCQSNPVVFTSTWELPHRYLSSAERKKSRHFSYQSDTGVVCVFLMFLMVKNSKNYRFLI